MGDVQEQMHLCRSYIEFRAEELRLAAGEGPDQTAAHFRKRFVRRFRHRNFIVRMRRVRQDIDGVALAGKMAPQPRVGVQGGGNGLPQPLCRNRGPFPGNQIGQVPLR